MTSIGLCYTSNIISFDKIWHHLHSGFAGGKDLSNDMKMLIHLSEKLAAKFRATTPSYSMVEIAYLNDAFSDIFVLEANPVEGQSQQHRIRKGQKGKMPKS